MSEESGLQDAQKKAALIGRLYNSNVIDLSDGEIERCLRNTCSPTKLIAITKRLRDSGCISIQEIRGLTRPSESRITDLTKRKPKEADHVDPQRKTERRNIRHHGL